MGPVERRVLSTNGQGVSNKYTVVGTILEGFQ